MTRATPARRRLLALAGTGIIGALLVAGPAHARGADVPPITLPPGSSDPVPTAVPGGASVDLPPLPPLAAALDPARGELPSTGGLQGLLLARPAPPAPPSAPAVASAPGPSPSPAPEGSPAAAPPPAPPPAVAATPAAAPAPAAAPGPTPAASSETAAPNPAEAIARAARSFTPLFALAAVVVAFLIVQGRVDRSEAKLATALIERDELEFR